MSHLNAIGRRIAAVRATVANVRRKHAGAAAHRSAGMPLAEPLEARQLFAAVAPPKTEPLNNGGVTYTGGFTGITPTQTPTSTAPRPAAPASPFPIPTPASDNNDQIVEAKSIKLGDTTNGAINYDTDVEMYSISLKAGQIIGIDVDDFANFTTFDGVLRLFDGLGNELAKSDDDVGPDPETSDTEPFIGDFTVPITGTYYIGVSGAGNDAYNATLGTGDQPGDFGPYILQTTLLGEVNDTDDQIGEARGTSSHYTKDDAISNLTDVDMYRITAKKGDRFIISANARGSGLPLDSAMQIFDASGNIVAADYGGNTMISFVAATKGNYYVAISGNANVDYDPFLGAYKDDTFGSAGSYRLKIDKV